MCPISLIYLLPERVYVSRLFMYLSCIKSLVVMQFKEIKDYSTLKKCLIVNTDQTKKENYTKHMQKIQLHKLIHNKSSTKAYPT